MPKRPVAKPGAAAAGQTAPMLPGTPAAGKPPLAQDYHLWRPTQGVSLAHAWRTEEMGKVAVEAGGVGAPVARRQAGGGKAYADLATTPADINAIGALAFNSRVVSESAAYSKRAAETTLVFGADPVVNSFAPVSRPNVCGMVLLRY